MRKWAAGFVILAAAVLFYVACGQSPTSPGTTTAFGPTGGSHGPSASPKSPSHGPFGPGGGSGGPSTPPPSSPPPSSPPPSSPPPSSPPPPLVLQITNLNVASGTPYEIVQSAGCCSNTMGRAWLDWPYILQENFAASLPNDPLYMIRTAIADTTIPANPLMTFNINVCATVHVIFGEKNSDIGCNDPYPSWIAAGGWACSIQGCSGTAATFNHESLGSSDQVFGPICRKNHPAGSVALGPREPPAGDPDAQMYTVFVKAPNIGPCP